MLPIKTIQSDFPILNQTIYGQPLVYLDNAATTQKPQIVLDRMLDYYKQTNSNAHRGVHYLAEQASYAYEQARTTVQAFIHAKEAKEIIFTRGTTESINLVATSFGNAFIQPGDEIIISQMEHHSNFVPWQAMCKQRGAKLKIIPVDQNGVLIVDQLGDLITERTRLIAVTYVSNALGMINPIEHIINLAHRHEVAVLIDAAQIVQHQPINVQDLDCDFLVFSGHKVYSNNGIGVLYGKEKWLEAMPPYQFGGGMIDKVTDDHSTYGDLPFKFEAGTGNVGAAISLAAAIEYVQKLGLDSISRHEHDVMSYGVEKLRHLDEVILYGEHEKRLGVISFNLKQAHTYDVGMILDKLGIMVRTGNHCAQPLMDKMGLSGTVRASVALYNSKQDMDRFVAGVERARNLLCSESIGVS